VRYFVAVDPPPEVRDHLAVAVARLRQQAVDGLRWPPPERWHLTLAFLGPVEDRVRPALETRLARVAHRHPPMTLSLAGAGRFGARVLWAGVAGDTPALRRLASSAAAQARHAGIEVEDRPYRPHLTLARADRPVDLAAVVGALADYAGPPWTADRLDLVSSRPGPRPEYRTVASWPLGGG